ncbi:hypothetical protein A9E77_11085 [Legionella pneumophila]|nr:hypothetical protein A9E77_11085 [Legionella pneumophila]
MNKHSNDLYRCLQIAISTLVDSINIINQIPSKFRYKAITSCQRCFDIVVLVLSEFMEAQCHA